MGLRRNVVALETQVEAVSGPEEIVEGLKDFGDRSLSEFNIAVIGDLHLDPDAMGPFLQAREQIIKGSQRPDGTMQPGARVVQLGDMGSYHHGPGSMDCFLRGKEYLDGFQMPIATILGNHDMEGLEFETDAESVAAWTKVFHQRPYWSCDVGPLTLIGLSTTRFRDNPASAHEVHVDDAQLQFLEAELERAAVRPVALFTHAPIMGSGLKVVLDVHLKNRSAWLNHSGDPQLFIRLVRSHPNIQLWFSGHSHLSHNYRDSMSVVGGCTFVQTGVMGTCNRDGLRQSRVLKGDSEGYRLYTLDHETGALRLDLQHLWADPSGPSSSLIPEDELIRDPFSGGLSSRVGFLLDSFGSLSVEDQQSEMTGQGGVRWFSVGGNCMLALQGDILVEYDADMMAPVGVVALGIPQGCQVVPVDASGEAVNTTTTDGRSVAAVELRLPARTPANPATGTGCNNGGSGAGSSSSRTGSQQDELSGSCGSCIDASGYVVYQRIERNASGTFFQIFQQNKWRLRKESEASER